MSVGATESFDLRGSYKAIVQVSVDNVHWHDLVYIPPGALFFRAVRIDTAEEAIEYNHDTLKKRMSEEVR